jgi:uncharacterized protein
MLIDQIKSELNISLKEKNEIKVSTLRFLISALNNKFIELQRELTDEDVLGVIAKQVKERKESIAAYASAGRNELAQKEEAEMAILSTYLPQQLSDVEVEKVVDEVISQTNASGPADFGKVMGATMAKLKGQTDGNIVSALVKKKLQ